MAHAFAVALCRSPQQEVHQPALLGVAEEGPGGQAIAESPEEMLSQEVRRRARASVLARADLFCFNYSQSSKSGSVDGGRYKRGKGKGK